MPQITTTHLIAEVDGYRLNIPDGDEAEDFVAIQSTYTDLSGRMAAWVCARRRALEFFTYLCQRDSSRHIVVKAWDSRHPVPIMTLERKY